MPPKGGTGGRPTLPPSQGLPPIIPAPRPARAAPKPVKPAAKSVVQSVTHLFGTSKPPARPVQSHLNLRSNPVRPPLGMPPQPHLTLAQDAAEQQRGAKPGKDLLSRVADAASATVSDLFKGKTDPLRDPRIVGTIHQSSIVPPAAIAGTSAIAPGAANFGRNAANDAIANITGTVPGLYHLGEAVATGNTGELHSIGTAFAKNDPFIQLITGHLAKGADLLYHHPVSALLDLSAGEAVAGRAAGAAARTGALGSDLAKSSQLAEPGAKVGDLARSPTKLLGNATEATRPYSKELARRVQQGKPANVAETLPKQVTGTSLGSRLRKSFNQTVAGLESTRRMNRADVMKARQVSYKAASKISPTAADYGVNMFSRGLLADPKVLAPDGTPLYRHQLSQLIEYHAKPVPGESFGEMQARQNLVAKLTGLMQDPKFEANPVAVHKQAVAFANDANRTSSRLVHYKYLDPQSSRIAKLVDPFHFYWRDKSPVVDPLAQVEGRSPFSIERGGKRVDVPVSQVERELKSQHGIDAKKIGFVSNKPFTGDSEQAMAGASYRQNANPAVAGIREFHARTGGAFIRGLYDPSYEALLRQHLTNQARIDEAFGAKRMVGEYALSKPHVADILEKKLGSIPAGHARDEMAQYIAGLRGGRKFFDTHDQVLEAAQRVHSLYPDGANKLILVPGRIAHHYSTTAVRDDLASSMDRLDPNALHAQGSGGDVHGLFPDQALLDTKDAGPLGLYHKAVADQYRTYSKDIGKQDAGILRGVSSAFRRANIALSIRHVPGVLQELGIRAATNAIGPVSLMRGRDLLQLAEKFASDPQFLKDHPDAPEQLAYLKSEFQGTGAQYAQDLSQHIRQNPLPATKGAAVTQGLRKAAGTPIVGPAAAQVVNRYNAALTTILRTERNLMEHPAQVAGLGKAATENLRAITSKNRVLASDWRRAAPDIAKGLLNSKNVQHYVARSQEYWGDWKTASPLMRKTLVVMPFFRWWLNSARFLLHTLPAHHPIKTGLLSAVNEGTRDWQQQTGTNALPLFGPHPPQALEAAQQGSIPLGNGFVANQQYYTPAGALTPDVVATLSSLVAPYAVGAFDTLRGYGPFGQQLKDAQGNPIPEGPRTFGKAIADEASEMFPLLRDVQTAGTPAKAGAPPTPFAKATGLPAGLASVLDPLRITKARLQAQNEASSSRKPRTGFSPFGGGSGGYSPFGKGGGYSP